MSEDDSPAEQTDDSSTTDAAETAVDGGTVATEAPQSRFWGVVPSGWGLLEGSEVYDVNPSYTPEEEEVTYIEMDALDTELPFPKYSKTRRAADYSGKLFREGDILFARITPCTENGKAAFVDEMETDVGIGSTEYVVLSPNRERIHPLYLYYVVKSYPVRNYAISRMRGSTGRQRVPFDVLRRELDIPLPPMEEQVKIASILSNVDLAIKNTRELIECGDWLKSGLATRLFKEGRGDNETREVRFSAIDAEIPEGWEVTTIGDASEKVTDGAHLTPDRSDSGYLLLSARNIKNGRLDLTDVDHIPEEEYQRLIQKCHPEQGDILMSCSGTIGNVCKVPEGSEFALVRSAALIKFKDYVDTTFAEQLLQSPIVQKQIKGYQTQSAQPNIFQGQIKSIEIPLPSLEEQRRLAEILGIYDEYGWKIEEQANKLSSLKRGLLQDLLTGDVRVDSSEIAAIDEVI